MSTVLEELATHTIALAPEDRARLVDHLLASLPDAADEPLDPARDQEIQRRLTAVESGTARLVSAEDVHAEAWKLYQR